MHELFSKVSKLQSEEKQFVNYSIINENLHINGKSLKPITCLQLLEMHKTYIPVSKQWMLDMWYVTYVFFEPSHSQTHKLTHSIRYKPDNCDFNVEKMNYINYVSI